MKVYGQTLERPEEVNTMELIPLGFSIEVARQRQTVFKSTISISRATCHEKSGPTRKNYVGEPKYGGSYRRFQSVPKSVDPLKTFLENASNGGRLMHDFNSCSTPNNRKYVVVSLGGQRTHLKKLWTNNVTMPVHTVPLEETPHHDTGK